MRDSSVDILVDPNTDVEPIALIPWLEQNPGSPIWEYLQSYNMSPQTFFASLSAENYAEYLIVKHAQNKCQYTWNDGSLMSELCLYSKLRLHREPSSVSFIKEQNTLFHSAVAQELLKKNRLDIVIDLFCCTADCLDCPWIVEILTTAHTQGHPIDFSKKPLWGRMFVEYQFDCLLALIRNRTVTTLEGFLSEHKSKVISTLLDDPTEVDLALTLSHKEPEIWRVISRKIDAAMWDASPKDVYRLLKIAYDHSDHGEGYLFRGLLSPRRLNPAKPIMNFKIFYDTLFEQYPDWFQETQFLKIYADWIRCGGDPITDILNSWPLDDQLSLLTKILQNLSAPPNVCTLDTVSNWKLLFSKNFDNQTMPPHIERLFWQTMYAADSDYRGKTGPQPCSDLRFHILTRHRDTLVENATLDYHLVIIQYIKDKLISRHSIDWLGRFLQDEAIPVQYRYFALTEQHAKDPRAFFAFFDVLPTSERAGFTASKPYKIAQCQAKIGHSITQLQTATHRLSTEERRHLDQACSTFSQDFQRYQKNEIDHAALFQSFTTTFNAEALQPILATHSNWYRLLLDIAMNILVIGSIVGFFALTAYRAYQGFRHGFFMHTQTNRQRMQKELGDTVRSLPEGSVFSF